MQVLALPRFPFLALHRAVAHLNHPLSAGTFPGVEAGVVRVTVGTRMTRGRVSLLRWAGWGPHGGAESERWLRAQGRSEW